MNKIDTPNDLRLRNEFYGLQSDLLKHKGANPYLNNRVESAILHSDLLKSIGRITDGINHLIDTDFEIKYT